MIAKTFYRSADTVQKANSGHPGAPMGMAPIAYVLWTKFLKYNPTNPNWANRDRFVLSNGHACALQYSILHLTGYPDWTMDDLKNFRQLGSKHVPISWIFLINYKSANLHSSQVCRSSRKLLSRYWGDHRPTWSRHDILSLSSCKSSTTLNKTTLIPNRIGKCRWLGHCREASGSTIQ